MKLHYMRTMNPRKVCALAKHLGSPVEYVPIDVPAGGLRSPEYLALNPNGLAPVLEDSGKTIWESAAIMVHLAAKARSNMWPLDDAAQQVEIVRWVSWDAMHFAPHTGTFYFENYIKPTFGFGPSDAAEIQSHTPPLHRAAQILDQHLAGRKFLTGETLTIADFCVGVLLPIAKEIQLPLDGYANIQRWHHRLLALPAWRDPWPS
jgi:glutathione S-transferase